ncbi:MAG: hypothetical protein H6818_05450 [Phycisphaerales bacterium]|nr:hypothetical protein [Phycisphaerales bacterium]
MQSTKIIILCIAAAILYGIAHDLVTAHICVEYFSEFHPHVVDSDSPIVLALVWGVLATWWVGLILGVILAIASRAGSRPKRDVKSLLKPILILFVVSLCVAMITGLLGYVLGTRGIHVLFGPFFADRTADWLTRFQIDLFAHNGSYAAGFIGGVILAISVFRRRGNIAQRSLPIARPVT